MAKRCGEPTESYKYVVRIINHEQRSKHVNKVWHNVKNRFMTTKELKEQLIESFEEKLPQFSELELGYVEKGAKRWIENDEDLEAMYMTFRPNDEIVLWCGGRPSLELSKKKDTRKRKQDDLDSSDIVPNKRSTRESKLEEILQSLREKHNDSYNGPQYRIWARMHLNAQHSSLDVPPNIPIFGSSSRQKKDSLSDALTSAATVVVGLLKGDANVQSPSAKPSEALSPGKRARVSGQYLEHLERLQVLKESGVLSDEEFKEQKAYALNNIRDLNK